MNLTKKLMALALGALMCFSAAQAAEVTVKATVAGNNNSRTAAECRIKAQKLAVEKFLKNLDGSMQEKLVAGAVSSYSKWIDKRAILENGDAREYEDGELTCEYTISIDEEKLQKWLQGEGWSIATGGVDATKYEVVLAEEPPEPGLIKMLDAMGTGLDGKAFFMTRYTTIQRRVRDALVKEVNRIGIDVPSLEDNEAYEDIKKNDPCVVGVMFDPSVGLNGDFKETPNFLKVIRENNPDTVVMYYRIDTMAYDKAQNNLRVSVSLSIKSLGGPNGVTTKSLGAHDYVSPKLKSLQPDVVMADMALSVTRALQGLLSGEGMNDKVVTTIKSLRAAEAAPKGPMTVVFNASKVDKKTRDDFLLDLEDGMVKAGLCKEKDIKNSGSTMTCKITSPDPKMKDQRRLWRKIKGILTDAGLDEEMVTDDIKTVQGTTMTVVPGKDVTND